jgi:sugar lactone lactonase YvrE
VTQTFTVGKAIPYVTWPNPGNLAAGTPLTVAQLNASANVAGTFSYDIPLGTVLPAGAQSVGVTFTPADFVDYSVTTARIYFKVEPASGGITTQNLLYISNGADGTNGYVTLVTASGATSTFADTLGMPVGLVFDAAGNLYVADYSHGTILKITPQGSRSVLATGFNGPVGMAVDASGTLFVSAYVSGTISKVSPSGKVSVLYAGLQMPNGLALDSLGNLYVAMDGSGTIGEISPSGQMTVYATGFNEPCGLAFDPAGNLYVADLGNLSIGKITPDGGLYTVATGLAHPFGIAIDGNGNIYAVDDADVTRITPAGVVSKFVTAGLSGPYAVAVNPLPLPSFSVQPVSQAVPVGHTVTLTAAEMGADSLQWYGPSGALAGATDATLTLSSIQASQAGIYTLAATNAAGVTSSNGATVGVITDTAPAVVTAPAPLTVAAGRSVAFSIAATGTPAPLYQWLLNGTPIAGATDPALVLSGASTTASGVVSCVVSNSGGTVTAQAALNVLSTSAPGRLVNLSARAAVGTGAGLMVGGLGISGSGTEDLLLRGVGPGLHDTFKLTGVLAAPQIGLFDGKGLLIASDTGWGSAPVPGASAASAAPQLASAELMSQVGAFSLAAGSTDGAMAISAPPGSYTLQVVGADNGTGLALVEIYDTGGSGGPAHLINLSARANVGTGTAVLIGGFAVGGSTADMVLLRGVGPGLTDTFGLTGTLAQPLLSVFDNGRNLIGSNAGWGGDPTLASVAGTVGAFALNTGHRDSALVVSLMPGAYTVEVSGADGGTGIALVEVYEVP